jgi:hypothetical protein
VRLVHVRPQLLQQARHADRLVGVERQDAQQVEGLAGAPGGRLDQRAVGAADVERAEETDLDAVAGLHEKLPPEN